MSCWVKGGHVELREAILNPFLTPTPHLAELFTLLCVLAINRGLHYMALGGRQHGGIAGITANTVGHKEIVSNVPTQVQPGRNTAFGT